MLNLPIFVLLVIGAITLSSGGTLRYSTERNSTRVEIRPSKAQVLLPRDETIAPGSPVQGFELLAQKPSGVYVITDRYASRPGPMSYCQSGQEQFVRVLKRVARLAPNVFVESTELPVESRTWTRGCVVG